MCRLTAASLSFVSLKQRIKIALSSPRTLCTDYPQYTLCAKCKPNVVDDLHFAILNASVANKKADQKYPPRSQTSCSIQWSCRPLCTLLWVGPGRWPHDNWTNELCCNCLSFARRLSNHSKGTECGSILTHLFFKWKTRIMDSPRFHAWSRTFGVPAQNLYRWVYQKREKQVQARTSLLLTPTFACWEVHSSKPAFYKWHG